MSLSLYAFFQLINKFNLLDNLNYLTEFTTLPQSHKIFAHSNCFFFLKFSHNFINFFFLNVFGKKQIGRVK